LENLALDFDLQPGQFILLGAPLMPKKQPTQASQKPGRLLLEHQSAIVWLSGMHHDMVSLFTNDVEV
jgi:hypothetical protein